MDKNVNEIKERMKSDRLTKKMEKIKTSISSSPTVTITTIPSVPYNSQNHMSKLQDSTKKVKVNKQETPNNEPSFSERLSERLDENLKNSEQVSNQKIISVITSPPLSEESSSDDFYSFSDEEQMIKSDEDVLENDDT